MNRLDGLNLTALIIALIFSAVGTHYFARASAPANTTTPANSPQKISRLTLPDGRLAVRDAQGTAIPLGHYTRIVSLSLESDALLAELCERDRLIGASAFQRPSVALHLAGLPRFAGLDNLESVIALAPDLVLVSSTTDQLDRLARLRQAGLTVCNLGPQRGVASLMPNARLIGALIAADDRAENFISTFTRRLANVAAALPAHHPRRRALYLGLFGHEIYGGTIGSSYHDVLTAAGLIDVAAEKYSGWPKLSVEELITLNPEVIVLSPTSAAALRALPGIQALRAVTDGQLLIIGDGILEDPGPGILDAAEAVFRAAYPVIPSAAASAVTVETLR
jgi:iron complex transport system substrate-binding protein